MPVCIGAVLFGSAGRLDLPMFWGFLAVLTLSALLALLGLERDLIAERVRPAPGGEDRNLRFAALPFLAAHLVVAGLDAGRFGWSRVPLWVQAAALAGAVSGMAVAWWAMKVNRFFSPVVRIQSERGHHLVTAGPYGWVRHPGYAGALAMMLLAGPALGSWWAIVPNVPTMLLMLRRLRLEDRYLRERLDGYREYARRVRWRLIPAVW